MDRIGRTLTLLAVLPRLGHTGLVHGTFEKGVPRVPYLIVYRIDMTDDDRELVVLRVYHGAQPRSKYGSAVTRGEGPATLNLWRIS